VTSKKSNATAQANFILWSSRCRQDRYR
jgi:hypothetical protein